MMLSGMFNRTLYRFSGISIGVFLYVWRDHAKWSIFNRRNASSFHLTRVYALVMHFYQPLIERNLACNDADSSANPSPLGK
ncbi:hypothetical protein C8R27_11157 [Nitrosomonas ureae]|nr:hypothetical protein C8R27_11157 [Nitrosomonas ureae]